MPSIGSPFPLGLKLLDEPAFAKCTCLIGEDVVYPAQLTDVILGRILVHLEWRSSIADQGEIDVIDEGFEPHVIVDPTVRQHYALTQHIQVRQLASSSPGSRIGPEYDWRKDRRKGA